MGYGRSRLKKKCLKQFHEFFSFLPQANIRRKKVKTTNLRFIKEISFRLYVCSSQKNRYFICNTHLLCNFFSSLICVNFTKKNNSKKKHFLFVCQIQICVNKNQRPFQKKKKKKKKKKKS